MSRPRTPLPTLTEVIEVGVDRLVPDTGPAPLPPESVPIEKLASTSVEVNEIATAEVLEVLWPRIDALLEARIREALAPHVLRLADDFALRLREELRGEVQALLAQALVEALSRRHEG
jgi:hypothetical protein